MRKTYTALFLAFFFLSAFCSNAYAQNQHSDSTGYIENEIGTIRYIAENWLIVVSKNESESRYFPNEIPEAFQADGLEVVFSAVLLSVPPGVRLMGYPVELRDLRKLTRLKSD